MKRSWAIWTIVYAGDSIVAYFRTAFSMLSLFLTAFIACFKPEQAKSSSLVNQLSRQILYTGVEALWLVGIIAFLCGNTIVIQAMTNMPRFGATEYFGNILVVAVVRELGPFFTSLVVVGRSGAALAAHLGTMKVNKEVAALEVMGIDPVHFIVVPALIGMIASLLCLNVYFDLIAIVGGLFVANFTVEIPFWIFFQKVLDALTLKDVLISLSKGIIFGSIIAIVSSWYGLAVKNIRGVPQASISSVVGSMALTIIFNVLVTVGFYAR
jgi:phospholipid/cholesterol/gamma-HCH transport system permease protein